MMIISNYSIQNDCSEIDILKYHYQKYMIKVDH